MNHGHGARTLATLLVVASGFGMGACASEPSAEEHAKIEGAKVEQLPAPDLNGRLEEKARNLLDALGLESKVETQFFPGSPPGRVVGQDPPAGTLVEKGSRVTVVVSSDSEE